MLKKIVFIFIACLYFTFGAFAQNPYADRWAKGRIMLTNGDTLKGIVNYNPGTDLLQINIDNTVKTYSAQQVATFDFFDTESNTVRYYQAFPYAAYSSYKTPLFFEKIFEAPVLSLLVRENIVMENVPVYDNFTNRTFYGSRTRIVYDFYFNNKEGKIIKYHPSKKELLSIMKDKDGAIKEYMKENRLRYNDKEDLIKLVDYYNYLKTN